jgi:hypothetical protein
MNKKASETTRRTDSEELALRVPRILRIIGEESKRKGTDRLSLREINQIIRSARAERRKRLCDS